MKSLFLKLTLINVSLVISACSPAEFGTTADASSENNPLGIPPVVICDPFEQANIVSAKSGLKGSIHFLQATDARVTSSVDLINIGTKLNADLFMNDVFVPTRIFSEGFSTNAGLTLKDENGETLVEWFALNLASKIRLAPGEAAGEYQLALLSDDGSTLSIQNPNGSYAPFIENESTHPTRMACATQTISMVPETRVPVNLSYFQGPRQHIAMIIMWRKVSGSEPSALSDVECGASGNDYFFDPVSRNPKTPYQDLLARGWKPLAPQNFELQSGSNLCAP